MKKVIRLTENDLSRIVRRVMSEMEDTTSDVEEVLDSNPRYQTAFDELVDILQSNPKIKRKVQSMVSEPINEKYEYMDYYDSKPKKISRKS